MKNGAITKKVSWIDQPIVCEFFLAGICALSLSIIAFFQQRYILGLNPVPFQILIAPFLLGAGLGAVLGFFIRLSRCRLLEQLKAQREMVGGKDRFRKIFQFSPALVSISTVDTGAILDVNDSWLKTLGYESSEVLGKTPFELNILVDPDIRNQASQRADQGHHRIVETQYRTKSGEIRDFLISGDRIEFEGQECYIFISQDNTERKKAEENYRNLVETTDDLIWSVDEEGKFTFVNRAALKILGYEPEEMIGRSFLEFKAPEEVEGGQRAFTETKQGKKLLGYETVYLKKDGTPVPLSLNTSAIYNDRGVFVGTTGTAQDITERKKAERVSELSRQRFRDFADSAADRFWETDENHRFVYVSQRVEEKRYLYEHEIIGMTRYELNPDGASSEEWKKYNENIAAHRPFRDFHFKRMDENGQIFHFRINGVPIFEEDGEFKGYRGSAIDETDKFLAQALAESTQDRLQNAIEAIEDGFAIYDADERLVLSNKKYTEIYNFDVRLMLPGTKLEDLIRKGAEEGAFPQAIGRVEEFVAERLERHRQANQNFEQQLSDGRWLRISERKMPDGSIAGFWTDITDLKLREEELKLLANRLSDAQELAQLGYYERDVNDKNIFWSEEAYHIFGIDFSVQPSQELFFSLLHKDDLLLLQTVARNAAKGHPYEAAYRIIHPDGSIRFVKSRGGPIFNAAGEVEKVIGTMRDVTEEKRREDQLRQAQKMEVIGQLTGGVAHDFNNLLHIMIGNTELLEDSIGEDKDAQPQLEAIKSAVDLASNLTSRLLAFSRQQTLSPVVADIFQLISSLDDMLRRTLGETINLRIESVSNLWPATIDPHQFENALINLAVNARDAMPGGGTLKIETANVTLDEAYVERHEDVIPGEYIKVAVSDSGTGILPEVLSQVFEPFFTTKEVGEGSGLGLSMVYGFVKQSKGHVTISSEAGYGTTIKLYLPRSEDVDVCVDNNKDIQEFSPGSGRILIVEDDKNVRKVSARILRNHGYEILEVTDGKEALEVLNRSQPFDLLFTDMVLPGGMNGLEIAEEAKRIQPDIKILYTTGYAEDVVARSGGRSLNGPLINKPYLRAELLSAVQAMLETPDKSNNGDLSLPD